MPKYTVFAVDPGTDTRYAEHMREPSPEAAEKKFSEGHKTALVAGVVEGHVYAVDEQ